MSSLRQKVARACEQVGRGCMVRRIVHLKAYGMSAPCSRCAVLARLGKNPEPESMPAAPAQSVPASPAESYYSRVDAPGAQLGLAPYLCGMVTEDPLAALRDKPVMTSSRGSMPPAGSARTPPRARKSPPAPRQVRKQPRCRASVKPEPPHSREEALARALEWVRDRVCKKGVEYLPLLDVAAEFNRLIGACGWRPTTAPGLAVSLRAKGLTVYRRIEGAVVGNTAKLRAWCGKRLGGER